MQSASAMQQQQPGILMRPRVFKLLEEACSHALAVITAGTGYGKTLEVRSYLQRSGGDYVWLQLTELDNYSSRFWDIYTHAMREKSETMARFMTGLGFPDSMEKTYQFLQQLSQAIFPRQHCYLVLDDFHKIEDPAIISLVETIVHANLENLTVILISRYPLPIDYSGMYNNGLLARVSVADLRFTPAETAAYFESIGLRFEPRVLENIQRSTEGWPLALYLIGLHRQNDGQLFNDPIACTIPLLYSLIEIEIFSHYSEDVRRCFVALSLLDTITPGLVKVLAGQTFEAAVEALDRNHFVYYNAQAGQYVLHRLFRRFLQAKKSATFTRSETAELYRVAGDWCAGQNRVIEALTYYKKCRYYPGIWQLLKVFTHQYYSQEMALMCLDICDSFPPEFLEEYPLTVPLRAHLLINLGEFAQSWQNHMAIVHENETLPLTPERQQLLGECYIGMAHISIFRQEPAFADYFRKAAEYLPDGSAFFTQSSEYVGNHYALFLFDGAPGSMQRMVDTMFELRPALNRLLHNSGYGAEYLCAAEAEYFQYNLGAAEEYAYQALYRAQEKGQSDIICSSYLILMKLAFSGGDYQKAIRYLAQMQEYTRQANGYVHGMDSIGESWFYLQTGQLERIHPWILATETGPGVQSPVSIGREKVLCALYWVKKKQYTQALHVLDKALDFYATTGAYFSHLYVLLAKAICHWRLEEDARATDAFLAAYHMAYGNKLVMFYIELGADMAALIDYMLDKGLDGLDTDFLRSVQGRAATYTKKAAYIQAEYIRDTATVSTRKALSTREKEILAMVCKGATREQIAVHFSISINTVKTNLKHIFAKLGAINRADAVRIALDSGMFDE